MDFFDDKAVFGQEMNKLKKVIEEKGYVLESDHVYAYNMQYTEAFEEVEKWLYENGYKSKLKTLGYAEGIAVYGLYDSERVTYGEMQQLLKKEIQTQNQWEIS